MSVSAMCSWRVVDRLAAVSDSVPSLDRLVVSWGLVSCASEHSATPSGPVASVP